MKIVFAQNVVKKYSAMKLPNKKLNRDKKQLAFCSLRSLILANHFLPVNWALGIQGSFEFD
jgi:hypothetical protein